MDLSKHARMLRQIGYSTDHARADLCRQGYKAEDVEAVLVSHDRRGTAMSLLLMIGSAPVAIVIALLIALVWALIPIATCAVCIGISLGLGLVHETPVVGPFLAWCGEHVAGHAVGLAISYGGFAACGKVVGIGCVVGYLGYLWWIVAWIDK